MNNCVYNLSINNKFETIDDIKRTSKPNKNLED